MRLIGCMVVYVWWRTVYVVYGVYIWCVVYSARCSIADTTPSHSTIQCCKTIDKAWTAGRLMQQVVTVGVVVAMGASMAQELPFLLVPRRYLYFSDEEESSAITARSEKSFSGGFQHAYGYLYRRCASISDHIGGNAVGTNADLMAWVAPASTPVEVCQHRRELYALREGRCAPMRCDSASR
jgi:hypothetical protein